MIFTARTSIIKKFIVAAIMMIGTLSASAVLPLDRYSISRDDLPQAAQETLTQHFPKAKVSMIKVDRHLLKRTDYDVKLTNGTLIEFSNKGKWTFIDCKKKSVPESLIPKAIRKSVSNKYPDEKIVRISRSSLYYTIGLANGKELKYDRLGIFQGELTQQQADEFKTEALAEADGDDTDSNTNSTDSVN